MKKIQFLVITLFIFLTNINIKAEEINISTLIEPTYTINIPNQIDISNNITSINYEVKGDLYNNQYLEVLFDTNVKLTSDLETIDVYINQEKTIYYASEILEPYSSALIFSHEDLKAGDYTGTLNLTIRLVKE